MSNQKEQIERLDYLPPKKRKGADVCYIFAPKVPIRRTAGVDDLR